MFNWFRKKHNEKLIETFRNLIQKNHEYIEKEQQLIDSFANSLKVNGELLNEIIAKLANIDSRLKQIENSDIFNAQNKIENNETTKEEITTNTKRKKRLKKVVNS